MIKDVMVPLDGSAADDLRLAAVNAIADLYGSHVTGLFVNKLPLILAGDDSPSAAEAAELMKESQERGDVIAEALGQSLMRLQKPVELRRFDVLGDEVADVAAREARTADAFVCLRPNGDFGESEEMVEAVLFGSGRHLFLAPDDDKISGPFENALIAWNGSRESARVLGEALPYLQKARKVSVMVVEDDETEGVAATIGSGALKHLQHHGIDAVLYCVKNHQGNVAATLIEEARERMVDFIVMGGYGHSRLREWLLGGTTYGMFQDSPVPLLVAH